MPWGESLLLDLQRSSGSKGKLTTQELGGEKIHNAAGWAIFLAGRVSKVLLVYRVLPAGRGDPTHRSVTTTGGKEQAPPECNLCTRSLRTNCQQMAAAPKKKKWTPKEGKMGGLRIPHLSAQKRERGHFDACHNTLYWASRSVSGRALRIKWCRPS